MSVKKRTCVLLVLFTLILSVFGMQAVRSEKESASAAENDPIGLFIMISVSVNVENGMVVASAKNNFTLFPATVKLSVMLYSSPTYQSSYETMTLAASNSTDDLNMGKTIYTEAPINGQTMYWQARAYYKADDHDWKEKLTAVWLIKADGSAEMA